jgi:hypothetical protein
MSRMSRIPLAWLFLSAIGLGYQIPAAAGPISVPNGDFSSAANNGSVGGGVGSGTNATIGSGPWTGSFFGVAGLLLAPTLTVASANTDATISGVAVNAISAVSNGGYFSQTLASNYLAGNLYILSATLNTGGTLSQATLDQANVGIALRSGSTVLASSATAPPIDVQLVSVGGTAYRLTLIYANVITPASGPINVQLFDLPPGTLAGAAVIQSVSFSDVVLAESAIAPAGSQLTVVGPNAGGGTVDLPFSGTFTVEVTDAANAPVQDVMVTLTAPSVGASALMTTATSTTPANPVTGFTDANGVVTFNATANSLTGCYQIIASAIGIPQYAVFQMHNFALGAFVATDTIFCNGYEAEQ